MRQFLKAPSLSVAEAPVAILVCMMFLFFFVYVLSRTYQILLVLRGVQATVLPTNTYVEWNFVWYTL